MEELDTDGDGNIEFKEFHDYMSKKKGGDYLDLFNYFDKNKDGFVSK